MINCLCRDLWATARKPTYMQWEAFILFETLQWPNTSQDMMTGDRWDETVTGLHLKRSYTKYFCYFLKKGSFETKKFKLQDIQIVESQNLNFYFQLLKCQSKKEEIRFTEQLVKSKTSIGKWKFWIELIILDM